MRSTMTSFQHNAEPTVNFHDYTDAIRDFVTTLLVNGRNPIFLDEMSARLGDDSVRHAMAVAHLALVMGIKLESYLITQRQRLSTVQARDVVSLGVAGMLHDVGKARLPVPLRHLNALNLPPDPAVRAEWENHVRIGYGMVRDEVEVTAAAAILNHHQHFDGTGFPPLPDLPQSGERIHIFARILLAADLYDRLSMTPDGKQRRSNLEILHLMQVHHAKILDPQVAATLPQVVPPFPPGSRVTLSDGRKGIVLDLDPVDPYRPKLRLVGADGWTLTADTIALIECPELRIMDVGGVTVEELTPAA
jgi:HD-GYP domain-containing protein (c-di-GMP phosphodiesterase class II)